MGGAKPLRRLHGITLIDRACALARSWSTIVAVAVRDPRQVGEVDATLLQDDASIEGPLAGIAAALAWAKGEGFDRVLTIPCDMPALPSDLADRLNDALKPGTGAASPRIRDRLQPACTLWRIGALDQLADHVSEGRLSLKGLAERVGWDGVGWDDDRAFVNVNTSSELARLEDRGGDLAVRPEEGRRQVDP